MKTIRLLSLLFLALIFVGCGNPDANFKEGKVIIKEKRQSAGEKKLHEARYYIEPINSRGYADPTLILVLSDDFGEANDRVVVSNKMMYAIPTIESEN